MIFLNKDIEKIKLSIKNYNSKIEQKTNLKQEKEKHGRTNN